MNSSDYTFIVRAGGWVEFIFGLVSLSIGVIGLLFSIHYKAFAPVFISVVAAYFSVVLFHNIIRVEANTSSILISRYIPFRAITTRLDKNVNSKMVVREVLVKGWKGHLHTENAVILLNDNTSARVFSTHSPTDALLIAEKISNTLSIPLEMT